MISIIKKKIYIHIHINGDAPVMWGHTTIQERGTKHARPLGAAGGYWTWGSAGGRSWNF